jgi:hypothetical protein
VPSTNYFSFEKEMLSVDEEKPKPDAKTDQPIQEPEIGGSSQPSNANPTKFVPHQVIENSPRKIYRYAIPVISREFDLTRRLPPAMLCSRLGLG